MFEKHHAVSEIVKVARKLRDVLGDMPFIFTIRTKEDGGKFEGTNEEYAETVSKFLLEGECDACDIELAKESLWFKVCLRLQKVTALRRSSAVTALTRLRLSTR